MYEPTPKSMIFENQLCPCPPTGGRLIFCDFPFGIKGKKSQDKKNVAFWSGLMYYYSIIASYTTC